MVDKAMESVHLPYRKKESGVGRGGGGKTHHNALG